MRFIIEPDWDYQRLEEPYEPTFARLTVSEGGILSRPFLNVDRQYLQSLSLNHPVYIYYKNEQGRTERYVLTRTD